MEWLDDLDTDGVVHALDLFGVSEEAREAVCLYSNGPDCNLASGVATGGR